MIRLIQITTLATFYAFTTILQPNSIQTTNQLSLATPIKLNQQFHSQLTAIINHHKIPITANQTAIVNHHPQPTQTELPPNYNLLNKAENNSTKTPAKTPNIQPHNPTKAPATTVSVQQIIQWIQIYSTQYNISATQLQSIAQCESRLNPNAHNHLYGGLFQFAPSTWISNRNAMGLDSNLNLRYNPEEAIKTAAFKISQDGTGAWHNCVQ